MALSPPPPIRIANTASSEEFGVPDPGAANRPAAEKPYRSKGAPSMRRRVTRRRARPRSGPGRSASRSRRTWLPGMSIVRSERAREPVAAGLDRRDGRVADTHQVVEGDLESRGGRRPRRSPRASHRARMQWLFIVGLLRGATPSEARRLPQRARNARRRRYSAPRARHAARLVVRWTRRRVTLSRPLSACDGRSTFVTASGPRRTPARDRPGQRGRIRLDLPMALDLQP